MVNHQIKVLQALASAIAEGGRGVTGTVQVQHFLNSLLELLSFMNLRVHHFVAAFVK